ncbi:choline-binding transcriptional repressor BetI [Roseobacter weihaiensis]|uniref:choline-binding transcriptional repressor BetI n=1 Tax=Roseobacter weihaiensis TaxID=2763262 RepID=UPI001D0BADD6|nr:transcriptional regulator BetI [Roseobacter sp. H9]
MPKIGMEPIRRTALVEATIAEIGARGSLDVTVGQIAKRAGMSTALAHHYFGGKDQIFLAAMRQILRDFGGEVRRALRVAPTPHARAVALIEACFAPACFAPATISAWMTLYASAQTNPDTMRLLRLYQARLRSNLIHALRPISRQPESHAEIIAALIDGLYLRAALSRSKTAQAARDTAQKTLSTLLEIPR